MLAKEKLKLKRDFGNTETPALRTILTSAINITEEPISSLYQALEEKEIIQALKEVDNRMNSQTRLNKFQSSIFYFALSQSEFICYFFMILNHLVSASLLSVPLPISIFLWAMLCIPRPTKTFWITSITYIEAVVVIKYLFQFKIFPWNQGSSVLNESLNKAISILGIEKENSFAVFDLFALLVIFLHRTILKRLGLWRDYLADDELLMASNDESEFGNSKNEGVTETLVEADVEEVKHNNTVVSIINEQETAVRVENGQTVAESYEINIQENVVYGDMKENAENDNQEALIKPQLQEKLELVKKYVAFFDRNCLIIGLNLFCFRKAKLFLEKFIK